MAKNIRGATKKMKDKWRSKRWYKIVAPPMFESVGIGDTLADDPEKIIGRTIIVTLDDLTGDFTKSHIKLKFRIVEVRDNIAYTRFIGHDTTSDYIRRLVRRKKSKLDGVFDVATRDGYLIRVKPLAITNKRIQTSQKRVLRSMMKEYITQKAAENTIGDFVKIMLNGTLAAEIYKYCKPVYPLKRVDFRKSEILTRFEEFEDSEILGKGLEKQEEEEEDEVKAEVIKQFMEIPGVGESKAEALYQGGIKSMAALIDISEEDLAKIEKIGPALAKKIKEYLSSKSSESTEVSEGEE